MLLFRGVCSQGHDKENIANVSALVLKPLIPFCVSCFASRHFVTCTMYRTSRTCPFSAGAKSNSLQSGVVDHIKTQVMQVRWKVSKLNAQLAVSEEVIKNPCSKCFTRLILE